MTLLPSARIIRVFHSLAPHEKTALRGRGWKEWAVEPDARTSIPDVLGAFVVNFNVIETTGNPCLIPMRVALRVIGEARRGPLRRNETTQLLEGALRILTSDPTPDAIAGLIHPLVPAD